MKRFFLFIWTLLLVIASYLFLPRCPRVADLHARGDVYGTNMTKMRTNPIQKVGVVDFGARVRYINEVYVQSGAGTIGDVIHLPTPPVGAKILASLSTVSFSAGVASATLAIGKTDSAAALKAATSITAAGSFSLTEPAAGADDVTIGSDEELIATNAGAAIAANQTIRFRIAYVENS